MKNNACRCLTVFCLIIILLSAYSGSVSASTSDVQDREQRLAYTSPEPENKDYYSAHSCKDLTYEGTIGISEGVDSNPLLDSTKKADAYTQEMMDMRFNYRIAERPATGPINAKFGLSVSNFTYYKVTDVDIFDGIADFNLESALTDTVTLSGGYLFEILWFPNDTEGTFLKNEMNCSLKQKINDLLYQKATYRLEFFNYTDRKMRLGSSDQGSDLRRDIRNAFEHEIGVYIGDRAKIMYINQFYINSSNDQYFDYYDYFNYTTGPSAVYFFNDELYTVTGFYYQRRDYDSRQVSDRNATEKDNLYTVTGSLLYDINKNSTVFINFTHSENHTNEPLEKYADNLYSAGLYYSF